MIDFRQECINEYCGSENPKEDYKNEPKTVLVLPNWVIGGIMCLADQGISASGSRKGHTKRLQVETAFLEEINRVGYQIETSHANAKQLSHAAETEIDKACGALNSLTKHLYAADDDLTTIKYERIMKEIEDENDDD